MSKKEEEPEVDDSLQFERFFREHLPIDVLLEGLDRRAADGKADG